MTFSLDQVVPWGRELDEYRSMFDLSEADFSRKILGCSDGPASFNAEATRRGSDVISCDPLYGFTTTQLQERIDEVFDHVMDQTTRNAHEFVWKRFKDPQQLGDTRRRAMRTFLADYEQGLQQGRYLEASLPELPFDDASFDLGLCSHFLFLYSQQFDFDFHLRSLRELLRVCAEVRVFPLLQLGSTHSPHVEPVTERLVDEGFSIETIEVPYEFQRGGNRFLRATP